MSTVQEIKQAVRKLPLSKRLKVIKWVTAFDNDEWDKQISKNAADGELDFLVREGKEALKKAGFNRFLALDLKNHSAILERVWRVAAKHSTTSPLKISDLASDPNHASLRFKPIKGHADLWSARIGDHYRAVGYHERTNLFIWAWIGSHEEYNKLIKR